jgi:hypothetical protein
LEDKKFEKVLFSKKGGGEEKGQGMNPRPYELFY